VPANSAAAGGGELQLQLAYPLVAENAAKFAADLVAQATAQGMPLDYTPASVAALDAVIGSLRGEGVPVERVADVLFAFGCYLGETIVRATGGRWVATTSVALGGPALFPIAVELPGARACDPVSQPFIALADGPAASLSGFFASLTAER